MAKRPLKSNVAMSDPDAAPQLVSGFYSLEDNRWRWTARQFVITFPGITKPSGNRHRTLRLNLFVPEVQLKRLGPLTLRADANGALLDAQVFNGAGMHTYVRDIPDSALETNIVPIVFYLDKAVDASGDGRELGLVVNSAELMAN